MNQPPTPTSIGDHTLQSLCIELVSGRPVDVGDEEPVRFDSTDTRAIFEWYRGNREKWAGRNMAEDVEAMVDAMLKPPPDLQTMLPAREGAAPHALRLKQLRAHQFGGLHWSSPTDKMPSEFSLELDKPLTLIQGQNGTGKTSLLSAICWCLTGHAYRSQREPEEVAVPVDVWPAGAVGGENPPTYNMAPITPMPDREALDALGARDVPLETWVELTFEDEAGTEMPPVRRSITRGSRGKITESVTGLSELGVAPVALAAGARFPAQIPYIQLGDDCDLGRAVGELIGIHPLVDLARDAEASRAKLKGQLPKSVRTAIEDHDKEFSREAGELGELLSEHPEIAPTKPIPEPSEDRSIEGQLDALTEHFTTRRDRALDACRAILGESFDPSASDLGASLSAVIGATSRDRIHDLNSMRRLHALRTLTAEETADAEALLVSLKQQAEDIAALEAGPELAVRERLYARIASWISEQTGDPYHLQDCPVCGAPLAQTVDATSGRRVVEHIQAHLHESRPHLSQVIQDWEESAVSALQKGLPEALGAELRRDLADHPWSLLESALAKELVDGSAFRGVLAPLKGAVADLCACHLPGLPAFEEPAGIELPGCVAHGATGFRQAAKRVGRALAFARWLRANRGDCDGACKAIVGDVDEARNGVPPNTAIETWALGDRLVALERLERGATPLRSALARLGAMREWLEKRRERQERMELYGRAASAIQPLTEFGTVVDRQVASLVDELCSSMLEWRDRLYTTPRVGTPQVTSASIGESGALDLCASGQGTCTSALHVSNSSELRAALLGFLFAFWRHLLGTRGGLQLMLLDDPQELLDPSNRRKVASAIPMLTQPHGQVIATTNSPVFRRDIIKSADRVEVDEREIFAPNRHRPCVTLGHVREYVDEKRRAFEGQENDDGAAQEYACQLRIHLDERLLDLLSGCESKLPQSPTFSDLIGELRRQQKAGIEPFAMGAFLQLTRSPHLAGDSGLVSLMNQSHHGDACLITYGQVKAVEGYCQHVCDLVEDAHRAFLLWRRRDPPNVQPAVTELPPRAVLPALSVRVIEDLAAATDERGPGGGAFAEDPYTNDALEHCAVYYLRTSNFGFAAAKGWRALADVSGSDVEDGRLLIALHGGKVYARRLVRSDAQPGMVALVSEAQDPLQRAPSLLLPTRDVTLLKVIGIIFDDTPDYTRSREEACLVADYKLPEEVEVAWGVTGDSALPLALPGQTVLTGRPVPTGDLEGLRRKGGLVALDTSEGPMLKRVGPSLPEPLAHARQFEAVGGHGASIVCRVEEIEDDPLGNYPLVHRVRLALGVLYDST